MTEYGKTAEFWFDVSENGTDPYGDPSVNVGYVDSIGDISLTADEVDDTTHGASTWKTYIAGLKDGGTIPIVLNYDSTDTSHNVLISRFMDGSSNEYRVVFPDASYFQFTAFLSGLGIATPKDEKIQRTFTFRIDGQTTPDFSEV